MLKLDITEVAKNIVDAMSIYGKDFDDVWEKHVGVNIKAAFTKEEIQKEIDGLAASLSVTR